MHATIADIAYYLPENTLPNEVLCAEHPDWTIEKVEKKTGIRSRHVVNDSECASDLAFMAAQKILARTDKETIDYLLFCTQSPDYPLPTTACILQQRLGLSTAIGALDFNLGCSGYVYGLSLAKGLIESSLARRVLLLTGDTYTRFLDPSDRSVRTIFGDAGTATLLEAQPSLDGSPSIGPFVFGTDGSGAENLIRREGANRKQAPDASCYLRMNGAEVFSFTLKAVPESVTGLLEKAGSTLEEVDLFVLHQANKFMLEHLRRRLGIPREKFVIALEEFGNTVSSTIPIALAEAWKKGQLETGSRIMLVGFGVGYSWASCMLRWEAKSGSTDLKLSETKGS